MTAITKLLQGEILTKQEAKQMQTSILKGEIETDQIIQIFEAFDKRDKSKNSLGIETDEFLGIVEASREVMTKLPTKKKVLDIVGTGGDGLNTFNISTLAAVVCAGCKVPVAKHGNRSATSKCGSFDVLEAVGIKIDITPDQAKTVLEKTNLAFLFAPIYHSAFRFVGKARKKFGKKTYFNFLGPVLNPAGSEYQVVGVSDKSMIDLMGEVLIKSGSKTVWLVQSEEGMDEISPSSRTTAWEFSTGYPQPTKFTINPEDYGLKKCNIEDIEGGDIEVNSQIFLDVLQGKGTQAQNNAVLLNAAAGLTVFGKTKDLSEGLEIAKKALKEGKVLKKFEEYKDQF